MPGAEASSPKGPRPAQVHGQAARTSLATTLPEFHGLKGQDGEALIGVTGQGFLEQSGVWGRGCTCSNGLEQVVDKMPAVGVVLPASRWMHRSLGRERAVQEATIAAPRDCQPNEADRVSRRRMARAAGREPGTQHGDGGGTLQLPNVQNSAIPNRLSRSWPGLEAGVGTGPELGCLRKRRRCPIRITRPRRCPRRRIP
jgi:hypothetical protein